ncbi:MAG TPA: hypothetical protein VHC22_21935 [Pirellulales bacterium]|nr:hypothetical protein [Pirellulales bacterium]
MGFWKDVEDKAMQMGAQGASELAHALYTGNAYTAYGPTERSAGAALPEQDGSNQPNQSSQPSYDEMKAQVAQQAPQIEPPQQEMER